MDFSPGKASVSHPFNNDVTFEISHPNAMRVELYSQDRDYIWPGNNQDYYLNDGETKSIPLSCN
ncbi:MAG: hypothetical protein E5W72_27185, partial [Mesorhizobium sp.]